MKKNTLYIIGGIIILALIVWAGYAYTIANSGEKNADNAVELYLDDKYEESLSEILEANRKGFSSTNLGIVHGQVLMALERYEEARVQFELVKTNDPSAVAAVDELMELLP